MNPTPLHFQHQNNTNVSSGIHQTYLQSNFFLSEAVPACDGTTLHVVESKSIFRETSFYKTQLYYSCQLHYWRALVFIVSRCFHANAFRQTVCDEYSVLTVIPSLSYHYTLLKSH